MNDDHTLALAMDTAGPACQVVLCDGAAVVAQASVAMTRGHGEALVAMVEDVLAQGGAVYEDLARLGVTIGPGSFTGLRVALAAARAFSATLNIPIIPIGCLEALAVSDRLAGAGHVARAVAVDARNGLVYGQRFDPHGQAVEPAAVMADLVFAASVLPDMRLVGPGQAIIAALTRSAGKRTTLGLAAAVPSVEALALLTAQGMPVDNPLPLYLKAADAVAAAPAGLRGQGSMVP
jgi:tRNA threonylcarbamoyladenosine biosynthesis protein TsaB